MTVPRWSLDPTPSVATRDVPLPPELADALDAVAADLGVDVGSVVLAAWARVLADLTYEDEVITGVVSAPREGAVARRLSVARATWAELVDAVTSSDPPVPASFETEIDLTGLADGTLAPSTVIRLSLGALRQAQGTEQAQAQGTEHGRAQETEQARAQETEQGRAQETEQGQAHGTEQARAQGTKQRQVDEAGQLRPELVEGPRRGRQHDLVLRIEHRTEVVDSGPAERIGGYLVRALTLLSADPCVAHRAQSLLSAVELELQLHGLAGPVRALPDRRAHELFEDRVRDHPDAVAAIEGDRTWTYAELDAHANRLGRALLARGLQREGVVGVVTERNLDWMASVLAVLKAGGAYLPIEPHFPADRIATTLRRSGCALVLTERASTGQLDQALRSLPDVSPVLVEEAYAEGHADGDLGVAVDADQLAYVYFTSGSTGEPKGAMCEHAGMLNHLLAKIEDLQIGEGTVVAQTAPQCFDISLWQLISALLVGGRTLVVPQDVVLDVARFVDTVVAGRVNVLQLVPSYLEVVLTHLDEHPTPLPDLRYVSVTGEAVKKELVQRWFATAPDIALVNAYGLTETSDDTNHAVLRSVPDRDLVPLGRPIRNVTIDVLDDAGSPVPMGAPGAIVFSGVCVGRGYVNDPERTRAVYGSDPFRPGRRRYSGGDVGRWLPDGTLEFLGRRDSQVKIRGFRIEIGEVENQLLAVPGVRDGAVVVATTPDGAQQLVAFYAAPVGVPVELLRERMGATLPDYMVPAAFHRREALPLTANSKIDTRALTSLAADLAGAGPGRTAPTTSTERWLAAAWASVLGLPTGDIGRDDHFFDRGGSSLSAVKLAVTLDRRISLKDVVAHPVLADLAAAVDLRPDTARDVVHA